MAKGDRPADVRRSLPKISLNLLTRNSQIIVLGGGLFASPYVRKIVEKTFHPVRILMPSSESVIITTRAWGLTDWQSARHTLLREPFGIEVLEIL